MRVFRGGCEGVFLAVFIRTDCVDSKTGQVKPRSLLKYMEVDIIYEVFPFWLPYFEAGKR